MSESAGITMNRITDKIPPQAIDLEESILGAMLIDTRAADLVFPILKTSLVFYKKEHEIIFLAISELFRKGSPIDLKTVSHELRHQGKLEDAGGDFNLIELTKGVGSSAHVEYHSRIVLQQYLKRSIIIFNAKITGMAYDDTTDVVELLDRWQGEFDKVNDITSSGRRDISFPDALSSLKSEIEHLSNKTDDSQLVGVNTGFKSINHHTGGYRKQDLVIFAARPGMGKTSKVLRTAVSNIRNGDPVGFVSLEMSVHQLTARVVAIDTDFHLKMLLKDGFDKPKYFERYNAHQERMNKYPFYIDDSGSGDISEVVMKAKLWKRMYGIKLLIVDYLQLMGDRSNKGNRENEMSSVSRRLKLLAKELDIPVIALSQLSRQVETRGGSKRPILSDLRESGAIEQDADIVEFIYRPGYYGIEIDPDYYYSAKNKEAVGLGGDTEIIFAKYRGGSTGTTVLKWVGDKTRFVDVLDDRDTVDYIDKSLSKGLPSAVDVSDENTVWDGK